MEPQEFPDYYFDEPITPRRYFPRERRKSFMEISSDGPKYMIAMVPVRLMIFILTLMLLGMLTYLYFHSIGELTGMPARLIGATAAAFLFFSLTQVIGHFGSTEMFQCPMLFCSLLGLIAFLFMGTYILYAGPTRSYARIIAFVNCYIVACLYATDILLAIGYWRHKYSSRKTFVLERQINSIYDPHRYIQTSPQLLERAYKNDVQTSITGSRIILDPYDDDPFRRYQWRRSARLSKPYIERPVRREFATAASRGMQSDYSPIQREAQTTVVEVKEVPVQTSSKCDLCQRPIEVEPHNQRQSNATAYEVSVSSKPSVAESARESIPTQTVPKHLTQSTLPTRKNVICFCKHQANHVPQPNSTLGPTVGQSCGSCNCLAMTIAKILTAHQHQNQLQQQPQPQVNVQPQSGPEPQSELQPQPGPEPQLELHSQVGAEPQLELQPQQGPEPHSPRLHQSQQGPEPYSPRLHQPQPILNAPLPQRHIETGTDPSFDMNLNAEPSHDHRVKETHQVYGAPSVPPQTNPFVGKLTAISHVHKNKRTQTKGQSINERSNPEKKREVRKMTGSDREEIAEEKFIAKEVEIRNIYLDSSHKVMPKHEITPRKGVNVKSHGPLSGRKVIEVKEKKNNGKELKTKPDVFNKEKYHGRELTPNTFDPNSSKTRTKTLYRETPMKSARMENEQKNKLPLRSDKNSGNVDKKALTKNPYSQIRKEIKTNRTASPTIEAATSVRTSGNTTDKNKTSGNEEKSKNISQDEGIVEPGRRFQSRSNSSSTLFRPGDLSTNPIELNSSTDWALLSPTETVTDETVAESGSNIDEIHKQSK